MVETVKFAAEAVFVKMWIKSIVPSPLSILRTSSPPVAAEYFSMSAGLATSNEAPRAKSDPITAVNAVSVLKRPLALINLIFSLYLRAFYNLSTFYRTTNSALILSRQNPSNTCICAILSYPTESRQSEFDAPKPPKIISHGSANLVYFLYDISTRDYSLYVKAMQRLGLSPALHLPDHSRSSKSRLKGIRPTGNAFRLGRKRKN